MTALGERAGLLALLGCQNLFDLPPRLCHHRIQSRLHPYVSRASIRVDPFYAVMRGVPVFDRLVATP